MNQGKTDSRIADIVVAILLLGISSVAYYITTTWIPPVMPGDPGATFFPRISLAIICFFAIVLLFQKNSTSRSQGGSEHSVDGGVTYAGPRQFFLTFVFSGLLIAGIAFVGFEPAAFAFLFGILGWRTKRWLWAFVTSAIAILIMYFVFVIVLNVRLPLLFLPPYLNIF
jgi:hypothetical protein